MIDFGVLTAIRDLLVTREAVSPKGAENVFINHPATAAAKPIIVLELEEIWTSAGLGVGAPKARLKLKARTLSDKTTSKESLAISERLRALVDGKTLVLSDGKSVTLRLENSVIDIPTDFNKTRDVAQFFEAIVRG